MLAWEVLRAVDERGAYANILLPSLLAERRLTARDRAFATELAYGSLRAQGLLDSVLDTVTSRPVAGVDPPLRDALRLGTYQLMSTRVPPRAAVATTVELVRATGTGGEGPVRFANAVLRRVAARVAETGGDIATLVGAPPFARDPLGHLAAVTAHPRWVVDTFADALHGDMRQTQSALEADDARPAVHLVAYPGRIGAAELADQARGVGFTATPGPYSPYAVRLDGGNPGRLPAVRAGLAGVQDEGSQLVALAAARAPRAGTDRGLVVDLCAGPGGKAALLAALLRDPSGRSDSRDSSGRSDPSDSPGPASPSGSSDVPDTTGLAAPRHSPNLLPAGPLVALEPHPTRARMVARALATAPGAPATAIEAAIERTAEVSVRSGQVARAAPDPTDTPGIRAHHQVGVQAVAPRVARDTASRSDGAPGEAPDRSGERQGIIGGAGREAQRRRPPGYVVAQADGRLPPLPPASADLVLVDGPCTGLGALRRRPEARWRKSPADVAALADLQRQLLAAALGLVRPGGVVAYATCSPHPAETEAVVSDVVAGWPGTVGGVDDVGAVVVLDARKCLPEVEDLGDGPFVQLWPHRHGTDAMFLALLRRTGP
jgi:16S rRNA (cytosine967-C5)-methyltransferase